MNAHALRMNYALDNSSENFTFIGLFLIIIIIIIIILQVNIWKTV